MANFTEREIKRSFIKLLNEKPLSKISVRDIVEDCGINRNSFYYHFRIFPLCLKKLFPSSQRRSFRNIRSRIPLKNVSAPHLSSRSATNARPTTSSTPLTATCLTASCFGCVTKRFPHI